MATIVIEHRPGAPVIHKDIYGHFSEHLGRCVYDGLWVGPGSSIPNTRGIRDDIVAALRRISIPMLRWPGGCFADTYHWKDGVGPRGSRPGIVNTHWGGDVESNQFGTAEFFDLCHQLDCDAYVAGNVGSGTVQEMAEWLQYITGGSGTPMGSWRAQHGHDDPWPLRYMGIGNENWGCGGNMRPEFYADLYRRYATYVKGTDNPLIRVACGPDSFDYNWTEILMKRAASFMDMLSLHYYTVPGPDWQHKGSATNFGVAEWFQALRKSLRMEELIDRHLAIMDRYDPEGRVALAVDEWGVWHDCEPGTNPGHLYQQNTMRDALVAALTLNTFNRHADRVKMGALAQTVNVLQSLLLTSGSEMLLTPTYHVFDFYRQHQNSTLLSATTACEAYRFDDESMDEISVSASEGEEGRLITIANVRHDQPVSVSINIQGSPVRRCSGRLLAAARMTDHNTFDAPQTVRPTELAVINVKENTISVELPPMSVASITVE